MQARQELSAERTALERPRVLALELGRLVRGRQELEPRPWASADPALERAGALGGSALSAALALERVRAGHEPPFVLAVGRAVGAGLPTAARASVAGRAFSGGWAEGQVGSELGRRLARLADAVALSGRVAGEPCVLVLDRHAERAGAVAVELVPRADLAHLGPLALGDALARELGPCASLRVGPAARRGLPYANLCAGDADGAPPSFVGRGGLGAAFGALGLLALVVRCAPVEGAREPGARALAALLARSPRLLTRAAEGTLELAGADALEGRLEDEGRALDPRAALAWSAAVRARARPAPHPRTPRAEGSEAARGATAGAEASRTRHGCAGCPTPCGLVFERPDAHVHGARFGALEALGPALASERAEDALALLAACDEHGLDAKEVGPLLGLWAAHERRAGGATEPASATLSERVRALAEARDEPARTLAGGAAAAAAALGLPPLARARGEAARASADPTQRLAEASSARGSDPMRTFAFLLGAGADPARVHALLPGLPPGATDPRSPAGKARLVAWHEAFVSGLDALGFCAFSAAGLLGDGLADLDALARALLPRSWRAWIAGASRARPGELLLAGGAAVGTLCRELDHLLASGATCSPAPAAAGAEPGAEWAREGEELARRRGLGRDGRPLAQSLACVGSVEAARALAGPEGRSAARPPGEMQAGKSQAGETRDEGARGTGERGRPPTAPEPAAPERRRGSLRLAASGPLAERLGSEPLVLDLPATLLEVLETAEARRPRCAGWLVRGGAPVPAVFRGGTRVTAAERVADGDELVLVLAIRGGAA